MAAIRRQFKLRGAVQGVGFRPFVYRLAHELGLHGSVNNSARGVYIDIEGPAGQIEKFTLRLQSELPPVAKITEFNFADGEVVGYAGFVVTFSADEGEKNAYVLPDLALCPDCRKEMLDPSNRRYRYPFINCTNCGPRFTIIEGIPYDRPLTSMRKFAMCPECQCEYDDPGDRRFHAQPNACAVCGPHLELWDASGNVIGTHDEALKRGAEQIKLGKVVALKGLGGFHLIVAAENEGAVNLLRQRKLRQEKPLAVMFPDLAAVREYCTIDRAEEELLCSVQAPIVLLKKIRELASSVAPHNHYLGVMLPYTPLHLLLLNELKGPIVATSGNLSEEPICTDEHEALNRLKGIADFFLVHNRPIVRAIDDSVVKIADGKPLLLRRARGHAPFPIKLPVSLPATLATGSHLKNTFAVTKGADVFLSQHIGDLENRRAAEFFADEIKALLSFYEIVPAAVVTDAHPDYVSTLFGEKKARATRVPLIKVQHHLAHVLAVMAENGLREPVLGVAWDGMGYGLDGTVWGGEIFAVGPKFWRRVAHLKDFALIGGDKAAVEPRRVALSLLWESLGPDLFADLALLESLNISAAEAKTFARMLQTGLNLVRTSSVGRLFDGVASLLGVRHQVSFEGQAAMELEFLAEQESLNDDSGYQFGISEARGSRVIDWTPLIKEILADKRDALAAKVIAARFHHGLGAAIYQVAQLQKIKKVILSGGVFQNKVLLETTARRLRAGAFEVLIPRVVPPNDGGICLGQIWAQALGIEN